MKVGCLGNIIFYVSDKSVKTIRDATWSGSANIQTLSRHLNNALTEFVGVNPDSFTFSMRVSRYLGSDPLTEISALFAYERSGTAVPLVIGNKEYGKDKWLIASHKVTLEHYDKQGNLASADISVTLTEYMEE